MSKLLITRFPLESGSGGEEELHFLLVDGLFEKGIQSGLWSSCPQFLKGFRCRHQFFLPAFLVPDPTSKPSLLLLTVTFPILLLQAIIALPYFRIRGYKTILMLTFFEKCFLTPLCHLLGIKVVWAHHTPLGKWFFQNPLLFLWKKWSREVNIIVPSSALKKELKKACAEENISVVSNAIRPLSKADEDFQEKLFSLKKGFAIGSAARLSPEKNLSAFIKTAAAFPKDTFFLAGDGPQKNELDSMIKKANIHNVVMLGRLQNEQLSALYSVLDVYLSCSTYETFGLSIAEAAACGVPAVAPRVGGIPDVVIDKKTGYLFDPKDSKQKNEQIKALLDNPELRKRMGLQAQKYATGFQKETYLQDMQKTLFPKTNST